MKLEVSKRRQPLVRTAVYSLMTLSVVVIVTLLMLVVLGYTFNEKDGKLEQGGLLQFQSIPSGAAVTLDEMKLGSQTSTKTTAAVGSHSVSFDRTGYRAWKKTINITAGQIGWLSYARLIPQNLPTHSLRTFTNLSGALASSQRNYMLLHEAADQPTFVLLNVQSDTPKYSDLTLPTDSYTVPAVGKKQTFILDSWSRDERKILIKHTYNDKKTEWILLDRDSPKDTINITTSFDITATTMQFAGTSSNMLFAQTGNVVRRINLDEQTLSRPLATGVAHFNSYDDKTIIYSTNADDKNQRFVGYASIDIEAPQVIATYPADGKTLIADMGAYFGHRYVAVLYGKQLTITTGTLPTPGQPASLKQFTKQDVPAGAFAMEMSRNGRFVTTQFPEGYTTYDIELMKYDTTMWALKPTVQQPLHWLDDYMLWSDNGGQLRFYEFDGANQNNVMDVAEGFSAVISPNEKFVYGVGKTDKGFELKRVQLVL